jgi:hypothetical protein
MTNNKKQPQNTKFWLIMIVLLVIIGGFIIFELGKVTGKASSEATRTSLKQSNHPAKTHSTGHNAQSSAQATHSSSVSSSTNASQNSVNSASFKLNDQNMTAASWNAAAVYYGAHALGYTDILSDVDSGSITLNDSRDNGKPVGDDGSFFTYHFTGSQVQKNQALYMGFSFTNKKINYYDNGNYNSPHHTVSLQQVLDYINAQHASQAIENMNCTFNN